MDKQLLARLMNGIMVIFCSIAVGLSGWCLKTVVSVSEQIAEMRGNRFTSGDGLEVWKAIHQLRADMAVIPKDNPPAWFKERVDKLENTLQDSITKVDTKIERHMAREDMR